MMHYFGRGFGFGYPMGIGGGWIMWIIGALVVGLIIYFVVRGAQHHHSGYSAEAVDSDQNIALKILNERYAKGDITDEEYKTKKMNLL